MSERLTQAIAEDSRVRLCCLERRYLQSQVLKHGDEHEDESI